jgi:hypothetical protein
LHPNAIEDIVGVLGLVKKEAARGALQWMLRKKCSGLRSFKAKAVLMCRVTRWSRAVDDAINMMSST